MSVNTEESFKNSNERLRFIDIEISDLERQVKEHRRPADELNFEMTSYLGRDELKFHVKESGYAITRNGQAAIHLSEGERSAIAFMYFLKSLEDTSFDLKTSIVVIDDPVSSLDANSIYSAFGYMKERTKIAEQLFILTHNFSFFRQVKNWFNSIERINNKKYDPQKSKKVHFYMLNGEFTDKGRNAKICSIDPLLHAYESEYHYLFQLVKNCSAMISIKNLEEVYAMPNIARRLLESFLAFRMPGDAGDLRNQLTLLDGDTAKKSRVIRFLHTYSHADRISEDEHDLSILSETPAVLRDVLDLIQQNDERHYDAMIKILQ